MAGHQRPDGNRRLDDPGDWVVRELSVGLARPELIVVPVLHDGARFPKPELLPEPIRRLADCQGVHLSGRNLDRWIDELVESIEKSGLKRQRAGRREAPELAEVPARRP